MNVVIKYYHAIIAMAQYSLTVYEYTHSHTRAHTHKYKHTHTVDYFLVSDTVL